MKRVLSIFLILMLMVCMAACAKKEGPEAPEEDNSKENTASDVPHSSKTEPSEGEKEEVPSGSKVLVVYYSATGTTRGVAETIARITGADIYEIVPEQIYTKEDLDWHDKNSRTTIEQNDRTVRPAISSEKLDLSGYETIYIGYPIWWGEEPRIMDTFAETYSFEGKTIIPFCTSGGSGIGMSGKNLEELSGSGNWKEGKRFGAGPKEDDVRSWIESIG